MWRVLWHHRRTGVRVGGCGRLLVADRPRSSGSTFRRGSDVAMNSPVIRVVLPAHLRTLAHVSGEVKLEVEGQVTQRSVIDALEARYPMLQGTIRDHVSKKRRPFIRFLACGQDLSQNARVTPVRDAALT